MHINARPFGERREAEVAGKIDRYLARERPLPLFVSRVR